jgi:phenylacetate-CoA ligase
MDRERLYSWLPVPLQNLAVSYEGRRIRRWRFSAEFNAVLGEYQARTFTSTADIIALRDRRLADFVRHAASTVPYYRELLHEQNLRPDDIRTLADLARLPILKKADVQQLDQKLWSQAVPPRDVTIEHTSGSTGAGLRFPRTHRANHEHWAVYVRYLLWHGLDPRQTWCLYFGGRSIVPVGQKRPPYWRWNYPGKQLIFSAYHLSRETAADYLRAMQKTAATWIHGYPSHVSLIADYALEYGVTLPIRWVSLASENVLPRQVAAIERAFGVRPIQHYAMAESVANISLCPQDKLHVDEDYAAVEFIPRGDDCHAVVGTNFTNPAFPLLRYEAGDQVTFTGDACDCGRPGRVVRAIDGRAEDYIVTRGGVRLGRLDHVFKDLVHVREAQLYQETPGAMVVRVVKGPAYTDQDERQLRSELLKRVGDEVRFTIEYRDELQRTPRGKLRFVVSK